MYRVFVSFLVIFAASGHNYALGQHIIKLGLEGTQMQWKQEADGWHLQSLTLKDKQGHIVQMPGNNGKFTLLYSETILDTTAAILGGFPEPQYVYLKDNWKLMRRPVSLNTAGISYAGFAKKIIRREGAVVMSSNLGPASIRSEWRADVAFPGDIKVKLVLTANKQGYYSMATPSLVQLQPEQMAWGMIPGIIQGARLQPDFVAACAYGHGVPNKPVVFRERTASSLMSMITAQNGVTISVAAEPGMGADPWLYDHDTRADWQLGLSLMNRQAQLSPTLYHPVLGEKGSMLKVGDSIVFNFRYSLRKGNWYETIRHNALDIYKVADGLKLKHSSQSLTNRLLAMHKYLLDDATSRWRVVDYKGTKIGAQDYLGGVYGSQRDAMKNADYGAMWMLARIMNDTLLQQTRLPYARNFKLKQQEVDDAFFKGAPAGQYFLWKTKRFAEEWGAYTEPVALSYYLLEDIGNVLLFERDDAQLRNALRLAADRLIDWMDKDGYWPVAWDDKTKTKAFLDLADKRPTFYGLLVAYKLLGDKKYLAAAEKGADWIIKEAVNKGEFLGVCGDTRFAPDFATAQIAQAMLDLYDITHNKRYLNAAINTAKLYTASVYTHPMVTNAPKLVNGKPGFDWQISQVGLSFEHGGTIGSANTLGPILLASHAGMFVRMFSLTRDSLFLHLARAGALSRDAFVDRGSSVASYYWKKMNTGPGSYPHHAWWQVGWITDYLLSEAELRSGGKVKFPRGFITPKVGPHQTYGFAKGKINGIDAELMLRDGLVDTGNPSLDYYTAVNRLEKKMWVVLLNNSARAVNSNVAINAGVRKVNKVSIKPFGLHILQMAYNEKM